jgi:hypothetical protein
MNRSLVVLLALIPVAVACSAGDSSDPASSPTTAASATAPATGAPGDAKAGGDTKEQGAAAPLTCASHTLCTSYQVAEYRGQPFPAATGGALKDGLYRLAYTLRSTESGTSPRSTSLGALLIQGNKVLNLSWAGGFAVGLPSLAEASTVPR